MEDTNYFMINNKKNLHERNHTNNNNKNPSKFYSHFLCKALIVTIFLIILPLFPSQAPEFINQTLNTRGWEFLHLVFVGIAVSYGLFSKRNDEPSQNENNICHSKFENAQIYVSRFLQFSSVFDDESDSPFKVDTNRVQTWSNQYQRNEAVTVVTGENPVLDQQQRVSVSEKPLLLPVRSLKSRVLDSNDDCVDKFDNKGKDYSLGVSNSKLDSKRFSNKNMNWGVGDLDAENSHEVLSSPIPWRSRSGRMEMKVNEEIQSPPLTEESEFNRSFKAKSSRSSRPNSATSSPRLSPSPSVNLSPKNHPPSPSLSVESQSKIAEDFVKKKSFYRSPPPPPPPPPPPASVIRKASSMKQSISHVSDDGLYVEKDLKRSFTTAESKDINRSGKFSIPKSNISQVSNGAFVGKDLRSLTISEPKTNFGSPKSVRTTRSMDSLATANYEMGYEDTRARTTKQHTFAEVTEDEKVMKLDMEFEEDSITEEEEEEEEEDVVENIASPIAMQVNSGKEEIASGSNSSDGGPDVDKKADEFIAKFREQIRLQRIESIKRSSTQQVKRNTGQ